jgi:hypothetical protein
MNSSGWVTAWIHRQNLRGLSIARHAKVLCDRKDRKKSLAAGLGTGTWRPGYNMDWEVPDNAYPPNRV